MLDKNVTFRPIPDPPAEQCACGNPAAWEMTLLGETVPLCADCYQIETLKRSSSPGSLLCDRIHRHWLIYLPELPSHIRSDGVA